MVVTALGVLGWLCWGGCVGVDVLQWGGYVLGGVDG